ncbi:MAG: hypothetical protein IPM13_10015 [Phycisphaerales bacterium]|nr:hypothetical protein [Phycisphaerales bacterium]
MMTPENELRTEAAIYAAGSRFTPAELAGAYRAYCREALEAGAAAADLDDFQRWAECARVNT